VAAACSPVLLVLLVLLLVVVTVDGRAQGDQRAGPLVVQPPSPAHRVLALHELAIGELGIADILLLLLCGAHRIRRCR
jgi:fumarate reductase subunit D